MKDPEKPRHAASQAVIDLRKALGMTQQQFAVEVLGTAVTTIARYETTHPPPRDVLERLWKISQSQALEASDPDQRRKLLKVSMRFHELLLDYVRSEMISHFDLSLGDAKSKNLYLFPSDRVGKGLYGYIFEPLTSVTAVKAASLFLRILRAASSKNAEIRRTAYKGLKRLASECDALRRAEKQSRQTNIPGEQKP
jgi:transcriptional regulator with XRE-family HTH domain